MSRSTRRQRAEQGLLEPERVGRKREEPIDPALHLPVEGVRLDGAVDQPPALRLRGLDGPAAEQELGGAAPADQAGQERRLDHRRDAHGDLGHAEPARGGGDPQVAGQHQLEGAAEHVAVEPRDRGNRDVLEGPDRGAERVDQRPRAGGVEIPHRRHVDARRERATRSGQDHHAEGGIGAELAKGRAELGDEGRREDVERRAVEREAGDSPLTREAKLSHEAR